MTHVWTMKLPFVYTVWFVIYLFVFYIQITEYNTFKYLTNQQIEEYNKLLQNYNVID